MINNQAWKESYIKNKNDERPTYKVELGSGEYLSDIKEDDGRYVTTCLTWRFCVPYKGNEHLLGTTNNVEG